MKTGYSKKTFLLILLPMVLLLFAQDRKPGNGEQNQSAGEIAQAAGFSGNEQLTLIAFPGKIMISLAINPTNPAIIYASVDLGGENNNEVLKSEDGGASWRSIQGDLTKKNSFSLILDPHHPSTIFAWDSDIIFKSANGGNTWREISGSIRNIRSMVLDPFTPGVLYVGCWDCIYKSRDGGENWRCIYKDPYFEDDIHGYWTDFHLHVHPFINCLVGAIASYVLTEGSGPGYMQSADCGQNWENCNGAEKCNWLGWHYLDPANPDCIYRFDPGYFYREKGLWRSVDGGKIWSFLSKELNDLFFRPSTLVMDPNSPNHLFIGSWDGLYASFDAGFHWKLYGSDEISVDGLAFAGKPSRLYVSTSKGLYVLGQLPEGHSLVVNIVQPKDQQTIYGIVPIQVEAKDDQGLARVEFFVNDQKLGERNCSGKSVSLSFDWDTRSFATGDYEIFVNAINDEGGEGGRSIHVTLRNVVLNLQCQKVIDRAWSAKKRYAVLTTEVQNPGHAAVSKYLISRRIEQGVFQEIKQFVDNDLVNGKLTWKEPLTRATPVYEYKVEAFDNAGTLIGQSNFVIVTND